MRNHNLTPGNIEVIFKAQHYTGWFEIFWGNLRKVTKQWTFSAPDKFAANFWPKTSEKTKSKHLKGCLVTRVSHFFFITRHIPWKNDFLKTKYKLMNFPWKRLVPQNMVICTFFLSIVTNRQFTRFVQIWDLKKCGLKPRQLVDGDQTNLKHIWSPFNQLSSQLFLLFLQKSSSFCNRNFFFLLFTVAASLSRPV